MNVAELIAALKDCPPDAPVSFTAEAGQVVAEVMEIHSKANEVCLVSYYLDGDHRCYI